MILNPNVNVDVNRFVKADVFTPDEGYALWRDNEDGNLDNCGNPVRYSLMMIIQKSFSEEWSSNIHARLIDTTMDVDGMPPVPPAVVMTETEEKAAAYDILMGVTE